jgi:hypothetical protein
VTKSGELAPLKFPRFKHEALKTADWHPGDDIGRIKVVISEVIAPGSVTAPNERITNIVAFSFQPAPLGKSLPSTECTVSNRVADIVFSSKRNWKDSELPGLTVSCGPVPQHYTRSCQYHHTVQMPPHNHTLTHHVPGLSCDDPIHRFHLGMT